MSASSGNWHHSENMASGKISQNTTYTLKFGTATCTAGGATQFTVLINDFTAGASRALTTVSFGSNVTATLTTNGELIEANDNRLIIYAGVAGATAGVSASYQNITLSVSKSVTYDSTYGSLPTSGRTGYTFAGWGIHKQYMPVEYLETTGGQYIDTGISINGHTDKLEVGFMFPTGQSGSNVVFGNRSANITHGIYQCSDTIVVCDASGYESVPNLILKNNVKYDYTYNGLVHIFNGQRYLGTKYAEKGTNTIDLFCLREGNSRIANARSGTKIYYFRVYSMIILS